MTCPTAFSSPASVISAASGCLLRPRPEAAAAARAFIRNTLADWGLPDLADDAQLIVTELLANALRHALPGHAAACGDTNSQSRQQPGQQGAPGSAGLPADDGQPDLRVWLLRQVDALLCAVTDPSDSPPALRQPGTAGESGRGLHVIHALSHQWGWSPLRERGKAVWAVLFSG